MIPVHYAALNDRDDIVELFFRVKPETMTQVNSVGCFFFLFFLSWYTCTRSQKVKIRKVINL